MKLEIVETLGDGYHIVELEEPEWVNDTNLWYHDHYKEVDAWCEQTLGAQDIWGSEPVTGWKRMRNRYYFVDKGKLSWFVLRWT
jgi:hypothetical protein